MTNYKQHQHRGSYPNNRAGAFSTCHHLEEVHGLRARPGEKINCPQCGHETLQISNDDSHAFCFYPGCGNYINSVQNGKSRDDELALLLDILLKKSKLELRTQVGKKDSNAYDYLTTIRLIHPDVIVASPVGVVPDVKNMNGYAARAKKEIKKLLLEVQSRMSEKNKPSQDDIDLLETLNEQVELINKLMEALIAYEGWLIFFYMDSKLKISSLRFRKPYTKKLRSFVPYKNRRGLFRPMISTANESGTLAKGQILLVEGEFNVLQTLTLQSRYANISGGSPNYLPIAAMGSVYGADFKAAELISDLPVICYDHDQNGAGYSLVESARQHLHIEAFTTPLVNSDLDNFIVSFEDNHKEAMKVVSELLENRVFLERYPESVAGEIYHIRCNVKMDVRVKKVTTNLLVKDLAQRCQFFHDDLDAYLFVKSTKQLIRIDSDDINLVQFLSSFGIFKADSLFNYFMHVIHSTILKTGRRVIIRKFSYYDADSKVLYVSNNDNAIFKVTADEIEIVDNGFHDVLFLSGAVEEVIEPIFEETQSRLLESHLFKGLTFQEYYLTEDEQKVLVLTWVYIMFFGSISPTRPILTIIAKSSSGKSSLLRAIGRILFGSTFEVTGITEKEDDLTAAFTNNYYIVLDNVDNPVPWLEDNLARAATGSTIKRRRLYTTNTLVDYPVDCFVSITARTPRFIRDDVANRLLPIRLQVVKPENIIDENELQNALQKDRGKIWGEILIDLQRILRAMEGCKHPSAVGFRMADFSRFAYTLAHGVGCEEQVEPLFKKDYATIILQKGNGHVISE